MKIKKQIKNFCLYTGIALAIGVGSIISPSTTNAEEVKPIVEVIDDTKNYKIGTFSEDEIDVFIGDRIIKCTIYVVKKNDSLSAISGKVSKKYYGKYASKYWPAIAYLNAKESTIIHVGDKILCPINEEDAIYALEVAKETGYTSNFIKKNKVYQGKKYPTVREIVAKICEKEYGMKATEDFIQRYLYVQKKNLVNPENKKYFDPDREVKTNDEIWILSEWFPTLEDLGYKVKQK